MTATTITTATTTDPTTRSARRTLWLAGLVSGAAAAVATTAIAGVADAIDHPLTVDGEMIPVLGFAQMTLLGTVLGVVLALVLRRRADRPQRTFTVTTWCSLPCPASRRSPWAPATALATRPPSSPRTWSPRPSSSPSSLAASRPTGDPPRWWGSTGARRAGPVEPAGFSAVLDPIEDRWAQPQPRSTVAEVDDGPRHVGIATLIQTHAVRVGQSEQRRELTRVDQLLGVHHRRHSTSIPMPSPPIDNDRLHP